MQGLSIVDSSSAYGKEIAGMLDAIDSVRVMLQGAIDDKFKSAVLNHLPQFVSVGAQSAGKSATMIYYWYRFTGSS